jgi:hypothetical protein
MGLGAAQSLCLLKWDQLSQDDGIANEIRCLAPGFLKEELPAFQADLRWQWKATWEVFSQRPLADLSLSSTVCIAASLLRLSISQVLHRHGGQFLNKPVLDIGPGVVG